MTTSSSSGCCSRKCHPHKAKHQYSRHQLRQQRLPRSIFDSSISGDHFLALIELRYAISLHSRLSDAVICAKMHFGCSTSSTGFFPGLQLTLLCRQERVNTCAEKVLVRSRAFCGLASLRLSCRISVSPFDAIPRQPAVLIPNLME